ncbi:RICIN domain-containing protein [Streptosporangium sandarakinum]|uniref:RICIN domain-containing protein n=1 Tax=Streptosporangium sandarakinum TaxID=1260955 RepID=UPI0034292805
MAVLTAGRTYVIRNRKTGYVLTVPGDSTEPTYLHTGYFMSNAVANMPSSVWHLFPLDNGICLLVNRRSGLPISVFANSADPSAVLEQNGIDRGATMYAWMLYEAPGGGYHIINKRSGLYMNVQNNADHVSARVEQYYRQGTPAATEVWDLVLQEEYKAVVAAGSVTRGPADMGDIVRMTSYAQPARTQTDPVLIGQVALPFLMVSDPAIAGRLRQSVESPYYLLSRYGYWKMVYYYEHGGASEYTQTKEVKVGLSTTTSAEIQNTVGISIAADASVGFGFKYFGFSASLSATISSELKVTISASTTSESSRTETVSRSYPAGKRVSEALWYKEDKYVLTRMDGTPLTEWVVRDPYTCITDAYPR